MCDEMKSELKFVASEDNVRIDVFLAQKISGISRSAVANAVQNGHVLCNGKAATKSLKLKSGDTICVTLPEPKEIDVIAQDIPLDVVYEDDFFIVVNKPKGLCVHPAPGHEDSTLVNAVLHRCKGKLSEINGVLRPGIVHRIDKNTSGLLVVAKDNEAHNHLAKQFEQHTITREYYAVVYGRFKESSGFVDAPIGRHPTNRKQMAINTKNGKNAYTSYEVIEEFNGFTLCKLWLKTGRTHQIRVHLASIGHPVAGDDIYGPKKCITRLNGQCLHAKTLGFTHPNSGERIEFSSELPQYFVKFLDGLHVRG